jgi:DNA-binding helix-hairpin-helix protein with protein kinase domain
LTVFRTGNGVELRLATLLGEGGEGKTFSIASDSALAVKIYHHGLAPERKDKITTMVSARLSESAKYISYPIDTIFDEKGQFSGFTMARMIGRKPAHQLYSPAGRKNVFPRATYPMLVHAAKNLSAAINIVHKTGCVVGDINHSGVLVSDDARIFLIDSDSFQFTYNDRVFPCKVGVPEFTPPELQGKDLSRVIRTTNHDDFGLAVLIFYILMMGRHPFAGRFLGQGDMPMERAIAEYRFAYSARRANGTPTQRSDAPGPAVRHC